MAGKLVIPFVGRVYVWSVFALGLAAIAHSLLSIFIHPIDNQWLFLAALTIVSGSATVRLPKIPATISVSETFVFTSILLFGVAAGTLTVALDSLVISFWNLRKRPEPLRLVFNLAAPALSVWVASTLFYLTAGIRPLVEQQTQISELVLPLLLTTAVYFLINSWLTAIAIAFEQRGSPFPIWRQHFLWLSLNYFGGASLAALLVVSTQDIDLTYLSIMVPLLLVLYLMFKTSMARVEDAGKHLARMNSLFLSTIETLAMAIDAKDQVTHGHIRRVQLYASGLAREVGMETENELRAIEAAALLHDMGKLAIPEHILNKPGKLTEAEFEKMKRHAGIGADILSAIEFPYPVVPIVRHHHENWDGSGYPDGLKAKDIPLGARVLSVVDCFDALTSDRPYRRQLPNSEAIEILRQRSGNMYDPHVVETFIRIHRSIAPKDRFLTGRHAIGELMVSELQSTVEAEAKSAEGTEATAREIQLLNDLAHSLDAKLSLSAAGDIIAGRLALVLSTSLCIYYMYEADEDVLVARHAVGSDAESVLGDRVQIGQRLTGWVGASRQTIRNSDPALDFGDKINLMRHRPRSCLSTPLVVDENLVGVLSLYSMAKDAFSEADCSLVETVARLTSQILWDTSRARSVEYADEKTAESIH